MSRSVISVVMVVSLTGTASSATAGEQQITGRFSGSFVSTPIDTNGDGMPGFFGMARGKTNLGPTSVQSVSEVSTPMPAVSACPKGNLEHPWLMSHAILQFEESEDLLFAKSTSGVTCFNGITNVLNTSGKGIFVGGTGQFINATGSFETTAKGKLLIGDQAGHAFEYMTSQLAGTIVTP